MEIGLGRLAVLLDRDRVLAAFVAIASKGFGSVGGPDVVRGNGCAPLAAQQFEIHGVLLFGLATRSASVPERKAWGYPTDGTRLSVMGEQPRSSPPGDLISREDRFSGIAVAPPAALPSKAVTSIGEANGRRPETASVRSLWMIGLTWSQRSQ